MTGHLGRLISATFVSSEYSFSESDSAVVIFENLLSILTILNVTCKQCLTVAYFAKSLYIAPRLHCIIIYYIVSIRGVEMLWVLDVANYANFPGYDYLIFDLRIHVRVLYHSWPYRKLQPPNNCYS